ncbi:ABC transporter transmembrane domain-containing protein [Sinosporangium album]|uniref:ABC transporter transmembrane domain-containing protein n=1 Tax=Sinosporangium album TaxID=504805 RepID=UPI001FDF8080|nr:ABC transporter ATP-binding protein [Sinosporangium album]
MAEALVPVMIGVVIDQAVATGDTGALVRWLVVLALLFTGLLLSWRFAARASAVVEQRGAHAVRMSVLNRALSPRGMRTAPMPGELFSVATSDALGVAGFTRTLSTKLAAAAGVIAAAVSLLMISLPLGLLVLLGTPPVLLLMQVVAKPLERRTVHNQALAARAGAIAGDMLSGLRVLGGIGAQGVAARRYREASRESLAATLRAERTQAWYTVAADSVTGAFVVLVAVLGAFMVADGAVTPGELVAVVGLAQYLRGPLIDVAYFGAGLAASRASARRVADLLNAEGAVGTGASEVPSGGGELRLDGVDAGPLRGVSLTARPGELLGVVTLDAVQARALSDLCARRTDPEAGAVLLDGVALSDLDPDAVRRAVVAPPHDPVLFAGTLLDNVVPGAEEGEAGDTALAALRAACADEVADGLPGGLRAMVAERGLSLSGGQRQRVALARALATRARVLVLHDPTTSVDPVTEARIADDVRGLRSGATTLLITGSPSLLAACDRVVVIGEYGVSHEGTHAALLSEVPAYREAVLA